MKQLYWILISASLIISILGLAGVYGASEFNSLMFQIWALVTGSAFLILFLNWSRK